MLQTTIEDVESSLQAAQNLNAAVKNLLKRESQGQGSAQLVAFAKECRDVVQTRREGALRSFIEGNYPRREAFFLGLARYAHGPAFTSIIENIFNEYAAEFNSTYETGADSISVTNPERFTAIVKGVSVTIEDGLRSAGLPINNFLKNSLLVSIFEPHVLQAVLPVLEKSES
jgi:hypothetical protein